jgi:hypothetical protein
MKMSKAQAERLVRRISESPTVSTVPLVIEAFRGQAHLALGHRTWQDFAAVELPHHTYSQEDRMKASVDLTEAGLSTGSAAAALGVDQQTVSNDLRMTASVPYRARLRRRTPGAGAARGARIKRQVDEYREVLAKHPTWTPKSVKEHLGLTHFKDVTLLRLWSEAPGEAQGYLYSGQITPAVAEAVLANKYVSEDGKLVVLRKIVTGVITSTGTPKVREIMKFLPTVQPYGDLVLRWSSPDVAMTFEQLQEALIDLKNDRVTTKREQAQKAAETRMLAEAGFNAIGWLDEVAEKMDLVEQMWPVLSANPYVRTKLEKKMAGLGDRLVRLAEQGQTGAEEPTEPMVIRGEIVN